MKVFLAMLGTIAILTAAGLPAHARDQGVVIDELDPFASDIEIRLNELDRIYQRETGESPYLEDRQEEPLGFLRRKGCYRESCRVFIYVSKSRQRASLYLDGTFKAEWPVSTGRAGYETPDFDRHPSGRIYDAYTSVKFPGGDFNDLGNMPYAVFIKGGFALHGTGESNWKRLGRRASHGCIRMHPDNAYRFNRLVRAVGVRQTWVTVTDD